MQNGESETAARRATYQECSILMLQSIRCKMPVIQCAKILLELIQLRPPDLYLGFSKHLYTTRLTSLPYKSRKDLERNRRNLYLRISTFCLLGAKRLSWSVRMEPRFNSQELQSSRLQLTNQFQIQ